MRRRGWRWLGVGLVVAIGLFFALDVVFLQYIESRGAAEIARTMSAEEATVDLGGIPFIPRFLRGRLSDVSVQVKGPGAAGGLRVQSVDARMASVTFAPGKMFALARSSFATRARVTAFQPLGILELREQDLEDFVRRSVPVVGDVRIRASGVEVRFLRPDVDPAEAEQPTDDQLTKPARYLPRVQAGRLRLDLTSVSQIGAEFRADAARLESLIQLPKIPGQLSSDVGLHEKTIVVESQGAEVSIEVGEGAA